VRVQLTDFSGGMNARDAATHLAANEASGLKNVRLDQRGGVYQRLGFAKDGSPAAFAANPSNLFYSEVLDQLVVQEGVNVRRRTGAGTFSLVKAFTTDTRVAFCDWQDVLLMLHPVDGLFSYDGTTLSARLGPASLKGIAIQPWQNRLWVAVGSATATEHTRIYYSVLGDETDWTGTGSGSVDLRDLDDEPLTALIVAPRGDLLAFKRTSRYRINDSTTGAYRAFDTTSGCLNALACTTLGEAVYAVDERGVWVTDGYAAAQEVSGKVAPFFEPSVLANVNLDAISVGVDRAAGTVLVSAPTATGNEWTLEYRPGGGWVFHDFAVAAFAELDRTLYFAGARSTRRYVYEAWAQETDDGTTVIAAILTHDFEPFQGFEARLQRLRVVGAGYWNVAVVTDYEEGRAEAGAIALVPDGLASYFPELFPRTRGRAFAIEFTSTDSFVKSASIRFTAATYETGGSRIHALAADFERLER
jgi:hypothetical protein